MPETNLLHNTVDKGII